ncbi:MAG: hypothetical protein ACD_47C00709G0002 [uncultured bacterium]|nr:MAG: hypothetical protein ACD_47C00709G0002 [uncultured bacterium]
MDMAIPESDMIFDATPKYCIRINARSTEIGSVRHIIKAEPKWPSINNTIRPATIISSRSVPLSVSMAPVISSVLS